MRILLLNYEYPPLGGGGGRVSKDLAEEWVKLGFKVDVISSEHLDFADKAYDLVEADCADDGINVCRVKVLNRKDKNSATLLSMLTYNISAFIKGYKLCRKNKYEAINTHFVIPTGPVGFLLSKIFKIKNILDIHGGDVYNPNYKIKPHKNFVLKNIIKFLLNKADKIIAHSSDVKEKAAKYYKIKKEIKTIPIGYKPYNFQKVTRSVLNLSKEDFYLITVGRLIKRKRIDRIIKSLEKIESNKIKLLIVGDGPEKEKLDNLVKKLNLDKRIRFLGYISEEKKYQYLDCSDIFISTSEHEGFGINFQEALFCGLPIVTTKSGGPESFLINKENALYINKSDDLEEIAKLILELKENRELYRKIGGNNIELIKKFDMEKIAREYLDYCGL